MKAYDERLEVEQLSNSALRKAIEDNRVSFPSQVPVFRTLARPDIHWRLVELYFVHNWRFTELAKRYGVTPQHVQHLVTLWRVRAVTLGFIQEIPPLPDFVAVPRKTNRRQTSRPPVQRMVSGFRMARSV